MLETGSSGCIAVPGQTEPEPRLQVGLPDTGKPTDLDARESTLVQALPQQGLAASKEPCRLSDTDQSVHLFLLGAVMGCDPCSPNEEDEIRGGLVCRRFR
jgi:hypothetical protein